jgi:hypothetical protein
MTQEIWAKMTAAEKSAYLSNIPVQKVAAEVTTSNCDADPVGDR